MKKTLIIVLIVFLSFSGCRTVSEEKEQIGKILWLKRHRPDIFENAHKFIDAKDFIIHRLTGQFVTSVDLAVVWWLLDTRKNLNQWDAGLCKLAGITPERLSTVLPSSEIAGHMGFGVTGS